MKVYTIEEYAGNTKLWNAFLYRMDTLVGHYLGENYWQIFEQVVAQKLGLDR